MAQALLAKNFGKRAGEEKGGEKAVKVKKVSPVVELMRLKQRAKQGDPRKSAGEVSMDDRLYVKVVFVEGAGFVERGMRELWLPKVSRSASWAREKGELTTLWNRSLLQGKLWICLVCILASRT